MNQTQTTTLPPEVSSVQSGKTKSFGERLVEESLKLPSFHVFTQDLSKWVPRSSLNYPAEGSSSTLPEEI